MLGNIIISKIICYLVLYSKVRNSEHSVDTKFLKQKKNLRVSIFFGDK